LVALIGDLLQKKGYALNHSWRLTNQISPWL
jgi:hypothetical protein